MKNSNTITINNKSDGTQINVTKIRSDDKKYHINFKYVYEENDSEEYSYAENVDLNIAADQTAIITISDWDKIFKVIRNLEIRICAGIGDLDSIFCDENEECDSDDNTPCVKSGTEYYDEDGNLIYRKDEYGNDYYWCYDDLGRCHRFIDGKYEKLYTLIYDKFTGDLLHLKDNTCVLWTYRVDGGGIFPEQAIVTGIYNDIPYTYNKQLDTYDTDLFTDLESEEQKNICISWVKDKYTEAKYINKHTSYQMKHRLQEDTGVCLTDNQFKHLMLISGYKPVNDMEFQWRYKVKYIK